MKIEFYQILVPLIGLTGSIISIRKYKAGDYTLFESFLWIMLWAFISFVAIFPDATTIYLSKSIGIKDHINAIIFIGLAISFFLNFRLFNSLKRQDKVVTDLVRKIAIERVHQDNNKG